MKPKNLQFPFSWDERRPLIFENILFVPQYYMNHREWGFVNWYSPQVFKNQLPIHFERVRKIWSKMRNLNLTNILIVCGEALTFTKNYVADVSFQKVYINFPDLWPKEKHASNRLLQEPFLTELSKKSKPQSEIIVAADHLDYIKQIISALYQSGRLWIFLF
ncbi:MAG: hypothetical protein C5B45_01600 [Chlamydiae bacterium]|nr:MAG: hypothetical protein C5B45_01600 [Chlamydiota bacterium]